MERAESFGFLRGSFVDLESKPRALPVLQLAAD